MEISHERSFTHRDTRIIVAALDEICAYPDNDAEIVNGLQKFFFAPGSLLIHTCYSLCSFISLSPLQRLTNDAT